MPDSVALTALIVSLVALFTTVGQLLQQYFATADGYRRCQPSVMGLWAKKTKLRWRWREFRFETTFVVPRIKYSPLHKSGSNDEITMGFCSLINTPDSLKDSMTYPGWESLDARQFYDSDELACWVPLLAQLHMQGRDVVQYFPQKPGSMENDTMVPIVQFVEKSWDFMPPDIIRPMASSTVSDIAIMARRLGMAWKSFDPGSGSMRAEGNGRVFTSTTARSLGTVLQYTFTSRKNDGNCAYIPVKEADKLVFGLVEFDYRLFGLNMGFDLDLGSCEGIIRTLPRLLTRYQDGLMTFHTNDIRHILEAARSKMDFIPGVDDLIPICSAMLSDSATSSEPWQYQIPDPNTSHKGVLSSPDAFAIFRRRLEKLVNNRATEQRKKILNCLMSITEQSSGLWESPDLWDAWIKDPVYEKRRLAKTCKNVVQGYHSEATTYLQNSKVNYRHLVMNHLKIITLPPDFSREELAQWGAMQLYFHNLRELFNKMQEHCKTAFGVDLPFSREEVEDAWLTMIFRAFCWLRSHVMIPDVPPVPSEYWNSKMPVYIG